MLVCALIFWTVCIVACGGGGDTRSGGGGGASGPSKPDPVIIEWKVSEHAFSDNEVFAVIQNNGASGKIRMIYTGSNNYKHESTAYFDSKERRKVVFPIPGAPSYDQKGRNLEVKAD
jgi:hypothetical protein